MILLSHGSAIPWDNLGQVGHPAPHAPGISPKGACPTVPRPHMERVWDTLALGWSEASIPVREAN
jgi:hypothetical protein